MNKLAYKVLNDLDVDIEVTGNPFNLPIESIFQMAARINKKRSFLFVSKVLGKHIPVNPNTSLIAGAVLSILYQKHLKGHLPYSIEQVITAIVDPANANHVFHMIKSNTLPLCEPTIFIGFAETATALGHSMFDIFSGPAKYIHTTREMINEVNPTLDFVEEHSHATSHRCYPLYEQFFQGEESIVLVDDEITTGKTAINIIRDLHHKHPRARYVVASLLDWRSDEDKQRFEDVKHELGITIDCLSLLQGKITVSGGPVESLVSNKGISTPNANAEVLHYSLDKYFMHIPFSSTNTYGETKTESYLKHTGRFGIDALDIPNLDESITRSANELKSYRRGKRTLCLGTGEFMYIPMRIASEMGQGVAYQSSTRSPIHPYAGKDYAIRNVFPFDYPEDPSINYFFYNIPHGTYDEVFVMMERESRPEKLFSYSEALKKTGIPIIHYVHFNN
ncbi:phosphoribosyltransferase family protein [Paenibacillus durus]|uniref:Phosphoribosyltransferase n=1 Tax=Paenibacillus durus ATCC 35681 TaxID=1333534 RepID=A0A0F7F6M2_PAEDU|nr:phosphoribosyltransferase family protein [Paenibacillus durus]AKG33357.1 hypothetical protein VK70_00980 [Paenibacillus durus ATCC 35681]